MGKLTAHSITKIITDFGREISSASFPDPLILIGAELLIGLVDPWIGSMICIFKLCQLFYAADLDVTPQPNYGGNL